MSVLRDADFIHRIAVCIGSGASAISRHLTSAPGSAAAWLWKSSYYDSVVAYYILICMNARVYGAQWRFENMGLNIPKLRHIVAKLGMSLVGGKTQLC